MIFDEVVFFTDTGFMEGGQDVPAFPYTSGGVTVDNLSITDAQCSTYGNRTVDDVVVQKATAFTEMKVTVTSIVDAMRWTYLRAKMTTVRGNISSVVETKYVYGWVDSVEVITSTDFGEDVRSRNVRVRWHVDLWRTYGASAEFGRGTVKRQHLLVQPQNYTAVQYIPDTSLSQEVASTPNDIGWVIIVYNSGGVDDKSNSIQVLALPFSKETGNGKLLGFPDVPGVIAEKKTATRDLYEVYSGFVCAVYDIAPSQIVSAWVCVYDIFSLTYSDNYYWVPQNYSQARRVVTYSGIDYGGVEMSMTQFCQLMLVKNLTGVTVGTTDTVEARVVGPDGSTAAVLPKGFRFSEFRLSVALTATSAYYVIRFNDVLSDYAGWNTAQDISDTISNVCGFEVHIPLDSVPVAANSWSEYAFSGDRQYDIDSRVAQQEIAFTKGLVNTGTSAGTGAMMGAMTGNPLVSIAGAVVGAVGGVVGSVGEKLTDEAWNGTLQNLEDRRNAGQHDGIALPGGSLLWFTSGRKKITVETLKMDAVTQANIAASVAINGYSCDVPAADCSSYFDVPSGQSYPLQIADLEVTGPIPNAARNYIRGRLAAGVRMVQTTRWS